MCFLFLLLLLLSVVVSGLVRPHAADTRARRPFKRIMTTRKRFLCRFELFVVVVFDKTGLIGQLFRMAMHLV